MTGAVSRYDLEACGYWTQRKYWKDGLRWKRHWRWAVGLPASNHYGIRKGRTARRVRRCLRREWNRAVASAAEASRAHARLVKDKWKTVEPDKRPEDRDGPSSTARHASGTT